jgi:hypothetical protein
MQRYEIKKAKSIGKKRWEPRWPPSRKHEEEKKSTTKIKHPI